MHVAGRCIENCMAWFGTTAGHSGLSFVLDATNPRRKLRRGFCSGCEQGVLDKGSKLPLPNLTLDFALVEVGGVEAR